MSYDKYAGAQRHIAKRLAQIYRADFAKRKTFLEIGCGTGFMTEEMLRIAPRSRLLVTDIAPGMLTIFKRKHPNVPCECMAGEKIFLKEKVDCIYSNMAVQWLTDPLQVLLSYNALLRHGGVVIFSTVLSTNFPEWQEACDYAGIDHGQKRFFSEQIMLKALGQMFSVHSINEVLTIRFSTPTDFLLYIKKIGAKSNKTITSVAKLRKACNYLNDHKNNTVSYRVAYVKMQAHLKNKLAKGVEYDP